MHQLLPQQAGKGLNGCFKPGPNVSLAWPCLLFEKEVDDLLAAVFCTASVSSLDLCGREDLKRS